jgi:hypothetical protein
MMDMQQIERQPVIGKLITISEKRRRWINPLGFILGVELPLIGGFWVWNNPWAPLLFLSVLFGALFLRSWWALLVVPALFVIGVALGIVLLPLVQGGWSALQALLANGFEGLDILLYIGALPVILLAALGSAAGVSLGKRMRQQKG